MELSRVIRERRSVRSFTGEPVSRETIEQIMTLAGMAPSSFNSQPWRFHVATGETRMRIGEILAQSTSYLSEYLDRLEPEEVEMAETFFAELGRAPVTIGVSAPTTEDDLDTINTLIGVGGAIQNLQLAATDVGLGSCAITFSYWTRDQLSEAFRLREHRDVISVILLGHPAETPEAPGRRPDVAIFLE